MASVIRHLVSNIGFIRLDADLSRMFKCEDHGAIIDMQGAYMNDLIGARDGKSHCLCKAIYTRFEQSMMTICVLNLKDLTFHEGNARNKFDQSELLPW